MTLWLDGQRSTGPTHIISSPPPVIVGLTHLDYPRCASRKYSGAQSCLDQASSDIQGKKCQHVSFSQGSLATF